MFNKIISATYIVTLLIMIICLPMSAIMLICKLCAATALSWIGCCVPLIIALSVLPIFIIAKILIDK